MAEAAGVPLPVAMELWRLLGFPHAQEGQVAFTTADVEALRLTSDLMQLGVLSPDRQAALVRTWGRSFARLAEWETTLLADIARERSGSVSDEVDDLVTLAGEVLPRAEALQTYIWRRHLASSASRALTVAGSAAVRLAVGFVDIVGYTSRSRTLTETELVDLVEEFEDGCAGVVVEHGGRVIKNLGDGVLYTCDDPVAAARAALELVARAEDQDDPFPEIRAGVAYGDVVPRLGDVFGPTVNIASRLTSLARPGTVLVDEQAAAALDGVPGLDLHKMRRASVKGYAKLQPFRLRAG
ncbi:adenylate/guanylate cyclase domain-containing protein [Nocardioides sp. KR10-350]|uniref:adenylate/guanylate cyclase domain-containing protein n=1 Tax=Nocardioides cheoyonin TaxID=3156615 RepID=UPI0032B37DE8